MTTNEILRLSLVPFRFIFIPITPVLDSVMGMVSLIPLWSPVYRPLMAAIWFPFLGYIKATGFLYRKVFVIRPILALISIPLLTGSDILFAALPSLEPNERSRKALVIESWPSLPDDTVRAIRPLDGSPDVSGKRPAPAQKGTSPQNLVTAAENRKNSCSAQEALNHCEGRADASAKVFGSCPTCGDIVRTDWERCPHCHDALTPAASEGCQPKPLRTTPVHHKTALPLTKRPPIGRCECCNNVIRAGEKRCPYCGGTVKGTPSPSSIYTSKVLPLNRQAILHCMDKSADKDALKVGACTLCGDMVRIGWEKCPRCGEPLDVLLKLPILWNEKARSEAPRKTLLGPDRD